MPKPNCRCFICKKAIYKIPSRLSDHPLCSYACRNKYFSNERSFVWKGGREALNERKRSFQGREKERERKRARKLKAIKFAGGSCVCCGYNRCSRVLTFHHLDPDKKDKTIKELSMASWKRIVKEVKKCILLCANCHMELHDKLWHKQQTTEEIIKEIRGNYVNRN